MKKHHLTVNLTTFRVWCYACEKEVFPEQRLVTHLPGSSPKFSEQVRRGRGVSLVGDVLRVGQCDPRINGARASGSWTASVPGHHSHVTRGAHVGTCSLSAKAQWGKEEAEVTGSRACLRELAGRGGACVNVGLG